MQQSDDHDGVFSSWGDMLGRRLFPGLLEQRWDQWRKSNIFVNRQLNEQFLWHSCLRKLSDWEVNLDLASNLTCV
jgi:hypothetical protein